VTGYQKSQRSSKLVAQITTKIASRQLRRQTDERETEAETETERIMCPRSRVDVRPTTLPRPHALDSAAGVFLGRATPHASPCKRAADDVTINL